jgi:hypothetical protein
MIVHSLPPVHPNVPKGPGPGDPGGCAPGSQIDSMTLSIQPGADSSGSAFVTTGTHVELSGSATVRRWLADCTSTVHKSPIGWALSYDPAGGTPTNVTSILLGGPPGSTSFDAGLPGIYTVTLLCPEVATSTTSNIFVGSSLKLAGSGTVWIQNPFVGTSSFHISSFGGVLVATPPGDQVSVHLDPFEAGGAKINPESAGGTFDSVTGLLTLNFAASISGALSGSITVTLSTETSISPPIGSAVSGVRRDAEGAVVIVGDAPVVGPPGTTHAWIQISGTLTAG